MNTTTRPTTGRTTYHRDGTVTLWDCITQTWVRGSDPSAELLATMTEPERSRVRKHTARCLTCGTALGIDCGDAEPDYDDEHCSAACYERTPRGPGRPPLGDAKRRPRSIKANDAEWDALKRRAGDAGLSAGAYVRSRCAVEVSGLIVEGWRIEFHEGGELHLHFPDDGPYVRAEMVQERAKAPSRMCSVEENGEVYASDRNEQAISVPRAVLLAMFALLDERTGPGTPRALELAALTPERRAALGLG